MAALKMTLLNRKGGAALIATGLTLLMVGLLRSTATATDVVEGNPTCEQFQLLELTKFDNEPPKGSSQQKDVTINVNDDRTELDWTSATGIDAVIMKGGNAANVYSYNEAKGDTGLITPTNASGGPAQISHVTFCYDGEAATTTTTPGATTTTTTTPGTTTTTTTTPPSTTTTTTPPSTTTTTTTPPSTSQLPIIPQLPLPTTTTTPPPTTTTTAPVTTTTAPGPGTTAPGQQTTTTDELPRTGPASSSYPLVALAGAAMLLGGLVLTFGQRDQRTRSGR